MDEWENTQETNQGNADMGTWTCNGYIPYVTMVQVHSSWEMHTLELRISVPETCTSGRDKKLHPIVFCGMQSLINAWDTSFWHQSP